MYIRYILGIYISCSVFSLNPGQLQLHAQRPLRASWAKQGEHVESLVIHVTRHMPYPHMLLNNTYIHIHVCVFFFFPAEVRYRRVVVIDM